VPCDEVEFLAKKVKNISNPFDKLEVLNSNLKVFL
jgi:hypothetical protein